MNQNSFERGYSEVNKRISEDQIRRRAEKAQTIYGKYEDSSASQDIPITWIPAENSQRTIIAPVAWSDYPYREFNVLRQAALAEAADAEMFIVGFPGMGPETDPLTPLQMEELRDKENPSFSRVGKASWDALDSAIKQAHPNVEAGQYIANRRVNLLGYSQGASHITGMLASKPENVRPESINIVEMADGITGRSITRLIGGFAVDGVRANKYFKENQKYLPELKESHKGPDPIELTRRFIGEVALRITPITMARATIERDLKMAVDLGTLEKRSPFVFQYGTESMIANEDAYKKLGALVSIHAMSDVLAEVTNQGDNHSFQESFPRYAAIADTLSLSS